jgi:hypothetical protein
VEPCARIHVEQPIRKAEDGAAVSPELETRWIGLISQALPGDAKVVSVPWTGLAAIFFIDRPARIVKENHRRSRGLRLYIPDHVVSEYLEQTDAVRANAERRLGDFVRLKCGLMDWDYDAQRYQTPPAEMVVIGMDTLFP